MYYALWPVLSFFLGLGLGHWLTISRELRKERREICDKIYVQLATTETGERVPATDWALLRRRLPWWKRRGLGRDLDRLRTALSDIERDNVGGWERRDPEGIKAIVRRLIRYTT